MAAGELAAAMRRIGELSIENELLRAKMERTSLWPAGGGGDGKAGLSRYWTALRRRACL